MSTPILCVAALITCGPRVVLVRSKKPKRAWELPGGGVAKGEKWRQAMTRESEEEIGLFVPPADWTVVDVLCGEPVQGAPYPSTIIVARVATSGPHPLRAGSDAADVGWFARSEIPRCPLSAIESRKVIERWMRGAVSEDLVEAVLAHREAVLKQQPTPAQQRAEHMWRLAEKAATERNK